MKLTNILKGIVVLITIAIIGRLGATHLATAQVVPSFPFIIIQDEYADFAEPVGGHFMVCVNDHQPNTAYRLWFEHKSGVPKFYLDFTTDGFGGILVDFIIPTSALPTSDKDYRIYTTLASNTIPVASCLSDLPTNAPCFQVISIANIEARNVTQGEQQQQPLTTARWPISSSIPIYLFNHGTNQDYKIKFNDLDAAPGTFFYDGAPTTIIPTDSQSGTNRGNIPAYYIATGYTPGNLEIASENMVGTQIATTTVELIAAGLDILDETPGKTHPAGEILYLTLRNHAPFQQYQVYFDDGITPPAVVRTNQQEELALSYVIPAGVQEPGTPPVSVEIYTLDFNRGTNLNKIARRTILIFTPGDPYLNVPGGAKWPAGAPILIQVRRHSPNTQYRLYLQQGPANSPTFSELINGATFTTDSSGNYNMYYTIPFSYTGFYVIRSFLPTDLTTEIAAFNIEFLGIPYIAIDNGKRWSPGSKITIRLKDHPPLPHEVWVDKGGAYETFLGNVTVYSNGEGPVEYTIPLTMPTRINPDYYPIQSYRNGALIAETYLEIIGSVFLPVILKE